MSKFRGYEIKEHEGKWIFKDTQESVKQTWQDRPCGHCKLYNTHEGHDGCLGTIPDAINACCGHGDYREAYIEFDLGDEIVEIREMNAIRYFEDKVWKNDIE